MADTTPVPYNEPHRLRTLASYKILDTQPEAEFDAITELAARHFGVPITLVSLVDETRQWFKSQVGLDVCETPRRDSFCAFAILGDGPLVVPDATRDPRFAQNRLVTEAPNIRFYAGAPLITDTGFKLGTLCLIDQKPRHDFTPEQEQDLAVLAEIVMSRLEARRLRLAATAEPRTEPSAVQEALEDVVAHLAHEIRTPLAAMVGYADVIEQQLFGPEASVRYQENARQIGEIGRFLCTLAQRTLDVARLRSGEIELQEEWSSLADLEGGIQDVLVRQAGERGVILACSLTGETNRLYADPIYLRQMVTNLLCNAIKYTPRGGRVELFARIALDGCLHLTIADNGPGMSPEETQQALLPFGRVAQAGRYGADSVGLGLPLTKRLVELHGGQLLIDSTKGRGTSATLLFPAYRVRRGETRAELTAELLIDTG